MKLRIMTLKSKPKQIKSSRIMVLVFIYSFLYFSIMAKTKSLLTAGLRGTVGGTLVFSQIKWGTHCSWVPVLSSKQPSESQVMQRERFLLASHYTQTYI